MRTDRGCPADSRRISGAGVADRTPVGGGGRLPVRWARALTRTAPGKCGFSSRFDSRARFDPTCRTCRKVVGGLVEGEGAAPINHELTGESMNKEQVDYPASAALAMTRQRGAMRRIRR